MGVSFADARNEDDERPPKVRRAASTVRRRAVATAEPGGLPDGLRSAVEILSGVSMDGVRVRYGSTQPARVGAVAFTQGSRIELAPGADRHLPHEAWHAAQQRQGRTRTRIRVGGHGVDDDPRLEREADRMAARATALAPRVAGTASSVTQPSPATVPSSAPIQREVGIEVGTEVTVVVKEKRGLLSTGTYRGRVTAWTEDSQTYTVELADKDQQSMLARSKKTSFAEADVTRVPLAVEVKRVKLPFWERPPLGQLLAEATKKEINTLVGDPPKESNELSEEQVEELIHLYEKDASAPRLGVQLEAARQDLQDIKKGTEKPDDVEERRQRTEARILQLETTAFQKQFGVAPADASSYKNLETAIDKWWNAVKDAEEELGFAGAYTANRMTARQINIGPTARRGDFQARHLGQRPDKDKDRTMRLDNTIEGIEKRQVPENFATRAGVNAEGLHDLSASLLRGDAGQEIFQQLKYYENSVVLFAPLPAETDLQIFSALAKWKHMDPTCLKKMQSLLTRPVFAQASDMGTTYNDTEPGKEGEGDFRYGLTGTVIRAKGDRARKINAADEASRRLGAIAYTEVATSAVTRVNEIVMAYRQHRSKDFPMYAKWDKTKQLFRVVDAKKNETGATISNKGVFTPK